MTTQLNVFLGSEQAPAFGRWFNVLDIEDYHEFNAWHNAIKHNGEEPLISDYESDFGPVERFNDYNELWSIGKALSGLDEEERAAVAAIAKNHISDDINDIIDAVVYGEVYTLSKNEYNDDLESAIGEWYTREYAPLTDDILGQNAEVFIDHQAVGFAARCNGFIAYEGSDDTAHYFSITN